MAFKSTQSQSRRMMFTSNIVLNTEIFLKQDDHVVTSTVNKVEKKKPHERNLLHVHVLYNVL
jgi:hypothetical protein